MPYAVRKRKDKWVVINTDTGDVKGTHSSRASALAQMRLLYGVEHGWRPRTSRARAKKRKKRFARVEKGR